MLKTLVLTAAGRPRRELMTFLRSIPGLMLLNAPDGALPSEMDMSTVDLLIFDACAPNGVRWSLLGAARAEMDAMHCIALVNSPQQMAQARAGGADYVLLKGFSTAQFLDALRALRKEVTDGSCEPREAILGGAE